MVRYVASVSKITGNDDTNEIGYIILDSLI
jgi:hypothetical protein